MGRLELEIKDLVCKITWKLHGNLSNCQIRISHGLENRVIQVRKLLDLCDNDNLQLSSILSACEQYADSSHNNIIGYIHLADSTLINSNKDASNFIFKIEDINDAQMRHINSIDTFKQKFDYIREVGGSWSFSRVSGETLKNNLIMLDLGMPHIVAACMEKYYSAQGNEVAVACRKVTQDDPLHINSPEGQPMYSYKIKQFLLAFALGMTVSSPWNGTFNANGGYIVVKEDGDVICYHFFDRNDLEEYLFNNTRFDTPSTTRHVFGDIYKENDSYFIKLNLQIRFIK